MKPSAPHNDFICWRNKHLFNIDFAAYRLDQHSFPKHFHDHYVIELVLSGADHFYCNGKNYVAGCDELVLINPGEMHTGTTMNNIPLHYFSCYPDQSTLLEVAAALEIPLPGDFHFTSTLQQSCLLSSKMKQLYHSLADGADSLQQQEIFFDCMQMLLQQYTARAEECTRENDRIRRVIDYIENNFRDNISLQQMAGEANINPYYLVRLFKKHTGVSPHEYLLIVRTDHARQLLRKGCRVEEAALASGFYDTPHLNRSFRKIAGTSPKSFLLPKGQFCTGFHRR